MPPGGDDSRYSQTDNQGHHGQCWRIRSGKKYGNDNNASGGAAGADWFARPSARSRNTPGQDREPLPNDTSPDETQKNARSLLQKNKILAYDTDGGEHVPVLLNRRIRVER